MNLSSPGFFFVETLFIIASISLLIVDLCKSYASRNLSVSSTFSSLLQYKPFKYSLMIL
jgi:hypothetical protein